MYQITFGYGNFYDPYYRWADYEMQGNKTDSQAMEMVTAGINILSRLAVWKDVIKILSEKREISSAKLKDNIKQPNSIQGWFDYGENHHV